MLGRRIGLARLSWSIRLEGWREDGGRMEGPGWPFTTYDSLQSVGS